MTTKTATEATFPKRITIADAPDHCPAWCDGEHTAETAAEIPDSESAKEYAENLATFREHRHYLPELLPLPTMVWHGDSNEVLRPGGFTWELMVTSQVDSGQCWVELDIRDHSEPGIGFPPVSGKLTSGEARSFAAQLLRAADAIEGGRL